MKLIQTAFVLTATCALSSPNLIMSKFLSDFFRMKNVMVTISTCRSTEETKTFLKLVCMGRNPKQVAIYRHNSDFDGYMRYLSHDNYFVIDLYQCSPSRSLIEQVNKTESFRSPFKYLVFTESFEELAVKLQNYGIYPSSELTIAKVKGTEIVLYQPYRTDKNSIVIVWENYGFWEEKTGLVEYHAANAPLSRKRHDLNQAKLNVIFVVTDNDTWNHLDDFRYPRIDTFTKQDYGTIRSLLDYCNVNASYRGSDYFGYYVNETGLWNGIVNEINHGRADLSGSSLFFTPERFELVDFTKVLNPAPIKFLLKKPPLSFVRNIFVLAFEGSLWLFLGIITSVFALVLFAILNVEAHANLVNNKNKFSSVDVMLIIFEAICQQGTTTEPKRYSGRIAAVILFMNFMFIYVSYSAYIVVLLQSQTEVKTLKHLLETSIEVGSRDAPYLKFYFHQAKDEVRKRLYQEKIYPDGFYSLEDGMAKVRKGFFAFNVELAMAFDYILEKFTDYDVCSLQELDGYAQKLQPYPVVPKNSPYKEIFKCGLLRIEEFGIQKRNFVRYVIRPKCHAKGSTFESIGITEIYHCLLVFVYGVLLSVTICAAENLTAHFKTKAEPKPVLISN